MKLRVVFDCMVFIQGAGRPDGPAGACLRLVDQSRITLCVSADILAEVRDVLTRPKVRRRFPGLSSEWVEFFVKHLESNAVMRATPPRIIPLQRDPKDEPYINLAVASKARYLVTRDLDLLNLMNDSGFRKAYPALLIMDPVQFLQEMGRLEGTREAAEP